MSGEQLKKAGHLFIEKKRNSAWKKLGKKKKGKKEKFSAEGENTRSSLAHLLSCIITYVHTCAISELQCRGQHYSVLRAYEERSCRFGDTDSLLSGLFEAPARALFDLLPYVHSGTAHGVMDSLTVCHHQEFLLKTMGWQMRAQ